jgi:hypothetical protein
VHLNISAVAWAHRTVDLADPQMVKGGGTKPGAGVSFVLFGHDTQLDGYIDFLADPGGAASRAESDLDQFERDHVELSKTVRWLEAEVAEQGSNEQMEELKRMKMDQMIIDAKTQDLRSIVGGGSHEFGENVRTVLDQYGLKAFTPAPIALIDVHAWGFDLEWTAKDLGMWDVGSGVDTAPDDLSVGVGSRAVAESVGFMRRFMYALWSLMAQPIAVPVTERPGRAFRRRWERTAPTAPHDGDVRVVTLRRATHGGSGDGPEEDFGPEWSHRWIVRGHWRKQWYSSESVHRLIWISPFVKGPDDKPLVLKDTVFEVVR